MPSVPVIQLNKLTKTYKGKKALVNTSFSVYQGELCGVAGIPGSGKTTLYNILCGLIRDYSGEAYIAGKNVTFDSAYIKRSAGFVPAEPGLPDELRAIDLVKFASGVRGYCDETRLAYLFEHFAVSRKKYAGRMTLSERKRAAIITAAFFSPQILIMDEPTLGLDNRMKERLFDFLIKEKEKGTTILMTCTDYEEARTVCSSVVVMHKGSVINTSEKEQLVKLGTRKVSVLPLDDITSLLKLFRLTPTLEPNGYISFLYTGEINDLILALSHYRIKDLNITYPSIGETVAELYESREETDEDSTYDTVTIYDESPKSAAKELYSFADGTNVNTDVNTPNIQPAQNKEAQKDRDAGVLEMNTRPASGTRSADDRPTVPKGEARAENEVSARENEDINLEKDDSQPGVKVYMPNNTTSGARTRLPGNNDKNQTGGEADE